jgi:hypothetical protein
MKCAECGAENREERKFCPRCGARLGWLCPQCGFQNEPDERFCGWADIPVEDPTQVGIHALCPGSPTTSTLFEYLKVSRPG